MERSLKSDPEADSKEMHGHLAPWERAQQQEEGLTSRNI